MDGVQALHHYLEATRLAFADRNRFIGDPDFVTVPQAALLSTAFGQQRACLIAADTVLASPVAPGDPNDTSSCQPTTIAATVAGNEGSHTNHLVVNDRFGNVASFTSTIEQVGGSGIVVPGRGFLLNNDLTDFNFTPTQGAAPDPNLPAAGKRPRSSMSPTIVLREGKPFLAIGSTGGASTITTVIQVLLNRIDLGMTLDGAVVAPRASQRNARMTQVEPAFLALPTTAGLQALGHQFAVTSTAPLDPTITIAPDIGVTAALEFLGGGQVLAVGEPTRRGGTAAAVERPNRR